MEEPMIFLLFPIAQQSLCFFRRGDLPPSTCPMKIISVKKEEDGILGVGFLKIIFWEDDEKSFFLIQEGRKKGLMTHQVLILLGWFWRKEIRKLWIPRTARGLGAKGSKRPREDE
jgi:hypothetical protein